MIFKIITYVILKAEIRNLNLLRMVLDQSIDRERHRERDRETERQREIQIHIRYFKSLLIETYYLSIIHIKNLHLHSKTFNMGLK